MGFKHSHNAFKQSIVQTPLSRIVARGPPNQANNKCITLGRQTIGNRLIAVRYEVVGVQVGKLMVAIVTNAALGRHPAGIAARNNDPVGEG